MKPRSIVAGVVCIAIPLAAGAVSGMLSAGSMEAFAMLNKPPLSPPGIAFPLVWTALYTLMGIASYLAIAARPGTVSHSLRTRAAVLYGLQLAVNFFWTIIFFTWRLYLPAFAWLVLLWVLIVLTMRAFAQCSKAAAYLLIPYLAWVTFAAYLNLGTALLNQGRAAKDSTARGCAVKGSTSEPFRLACRYMRPH